MTPKRCEHWYPEAKAEKEPSPWWYFGRAIYVSRHDYRRILLAFLALGIPFGIISIALQSRNFFCAASTIAAIGLLMFLYSLIGLYRQYGHPSLEYFQTLLNLGHIEGSVAVADFHIGTYRHSYRLAGLLPEAMIHSIDCWNMEDASSEKAIREVRDLEPVPVGHPRIQPMKALNLTVPLADASCDVVVFGFGTHEISVDGPREQIFSEARRILKPGGTVLLFEHGVDFHNYLIFGPAINHVTMKEDWMKLMQRYFSDIRSARTSHAVDLIRGIRHA